MVRKIEQNAHIILQIETHKNFQKKNISYLKNRHRWIKNIDVKRDEVSLNGSESHHQ
jgi:hypothetical protein